jgi:6,7-dimethyl-8-ribityllumazine synthase
VARSALAAADLQAGLTLPPAELEGAAARAAGWRARGGGAILFRPAPGPDRAGRSTGPDRSFQTPAMSLGSDPSALPRLASPARVALVVSSYHAEITGGMADAAAETLRAAGVGAGELVRVDAPGAFELPVLAQRLARRADVDAVLCFGLVLKGETEHDRHIAAAVADGLMRVGLESGKPVLFGVLTCNTLEQAQARARRRADGGLDKGAEVARACVETLNALALAEGREVAR